MVIGMYFNDLTLPRAQYKIQTMKKFITSLVLMFAFVGTAGAYIDHQTAVLRIMNKAAGKAQTITVPVDSKHRFEKLNIIVRACKQTDPFQAEDFFAFVEISQSTDGLIFSNWMSRNEPGYNPLQNPDYDVWLVGCE